MIHSGDIYVDAAELAETLPILQKSLAEAKQGKGRPCEISSMKLPTQPALLLSDEIFCRDNSDRRGRIEERVQIFHALTANICQRHSNP